MALHINHPEVDRLVKEIATRERKTKTEVVLDALRKKAAVRSEEQVQALIAADREWLLRRWETLPADQRGRMPTREEEDEILGYGPFGHCE